MTVFLDAHSCSFPDYNEADENGIIAVGGDFSSKRLLKAYEAGIFPWPHEGLPLLWFFPPSRYVLKPADLRINKSLKKAMKESDLIIEADRDFLATMKACQNSARASQENKTWITDAMIEGYSELHRLGFAHSIEAYRDNRLVGGLYGVSLGTMFFGESMFYLETNASKICFITLVAHLLAWHFTLIDCQMPTHTFASFGAQFISKEAFLLRLNDSRKTPTKKGPWQLSLSPQEALLKFI